MRRSHIHLREAADRRAIGRFGLHVDAIGAIVQVEVVHVCRSFEHAERLRERSEGDAELLGLLPIDRKIELWRVIPEAGERRREVRVCVDRPDEPVHRRRGSGEADVVLIDDLELKAPEVPDPLDRRRIEGKHLRVRFRRDDRIEPGENRLERVRWAVAFAPRLERDERDAAVWGAAGEAESVEGEDAFRFRYGVVDPLRKARRDAVLVVGRGARRRLQDDDEIALVLVGDERSRRSEVHEARHGEREREHAQHGTPKAQQGRKKSVIRAPQPRYRPVDQAEDRRGRRVIVAQEQRRERRRKRQRRKERDRDRAGNRHRELLVEQPGRAGEECDGDEHREQDQRGCDHGARDLAHRALRRGQRRHLLLLSEARDVLDDHDRVVDDEPSREGQTEERERVDREPQKLHEGERADERDRDRDHRHERHLPVLDEGIDDQDDEQDRERERHRDLLDRLAHEQRRVEGNRVGDSGRERLRYLDERRADLGGEIERVRVRLLDDDETHALLPVPVRRGRVILGAELDVPDVGDADVPAVARRFDDDVRELLGGREPTLSVQLDLVELVARRRRRPD